MSKAKAKIIYVPEYYEQPAQKQKKEKDGLSFTYQSFQENYFKIFRFLNTRDQDVILLMDAKQKTQNEIAEIFDFSQPKLSYDRKKINDRIGFLLDLQKKFDRYLVFLENESQNYTEEMKLILTAMIFTTSYSRTAELTGINYGAVRSKFSMILSMLKKDNPEVYEIFKFIEDNLNIVRRLNRGNKYNREIAANKK